MRHILFFSGLVGVVLSDNKCNGFGFKSTTVGAYQIPRSDWLFYQIRSCVAEMGASVAACVDYWSGSVTQAAQADQSCGTCIKFF